VHENRIFNFDIFLVIKICILILALFSKSRQPRKVGKAFRKPFRTFFPKALCDLVANPTHSCCQKTSGILRHGLPEIASVLSDAAYFLGRYGLEMLTCLGIIFSHLIKCSQIIKYLEGCWRPTPAPGWLIQKRISWHFSC
jgi:hypothetical protein